MATLLPPSTDITASSTKQGGAKVYHAAIRAFLAALLGTDAEDKPAARAALGAQAASDVLSGIAAGTTSTAFKNVLINGRLNINQRNVTIAAAAIGAYGPDRWKKVDASNMTQIVEDGNYKYSSVYTLSGNGVTTQQVTSPASGHWTIPSIPITATYVQLELGAIATSFENRPIGIELALCQRYFQVMSGIAVAGYGVAGNTLMSTYTFQPTMRSAPSITWTSYGTQLNATSPAFFGTTEVATGPSVNAIADGPVYIYGATATASAEL